MTVERGTGLEPATACLEGRGSTTELPPLGYTLVYSIAPRLARTLHYFDSQPAARHEIRHVQAKPGNHGDYNRPRYAELVEMRQHR